MELSSCFFSFFVLITILIYFINLVSNLVFSLFKVWRRSTVEDYS